MSIVTESLVPCPVPPITHPMGKHWDQPDPALMQFYADRVVMKEGVFLGLADYSCSIPSGVYDGKMWRRCQGAHTPLPKEQRRWFLCWFGPSDDPDKCSIHSLPLVIA